MKKYFPSIIKYDNYSFLNNAAGSQVSEQVINNLNNNIINCYTQPFDNNIISLNNQDSIKNANNNTNIIINNNNKGKVIYGNSCSQLMFNLSKSIEKFLCENKGNIVISSFNHEACITPFERIALINNIEVRWWNINYDSNNNITTVDYNNLLEKIDKSTNLVIIPHVSNILGNIINLEYLSREIKKINTNIKILVDGVAYLPHGEVDVELYNIDLYVISFYKFCGLRISAMYIKNDFMENIENINHIFFDNEKINNENKMQIGGINYECLSSINGLIKYFDDVSKQFNYKNNSEIFDRNNYLFCMDKIKIYEKIFNKLFESLLKNNNSIICFQDKKISNVPIYSLKFKNYNSRYIVNTLNNFNIIVGGGTFYCNRLIEQLKLNKNDGVVRISLMHYNTFSEINNLIEILNKFKKYDMAFNFTLHSNLKNNLTNKIKDSFNNINIDSYYENKRLRAFSLLKINDNNLEIINNADFFQSTNYNSYNGNKIRKYENIPSCLLDDLCFKLLVKTFIENAESNMYDSIKYIYVHQIRVYAENDKETNLIPEGIHRDGYNIIGMVCINRENISGGISGIYDSEKNKVYDVQLQSGEMLIVNDNKMFHDVTNIIKYKENKEGYRDIFVFTTIS